MERKLAAIFSTDVKGYSRLMGDDEEATIQTLKTYREVISGLIEQHHGRVVDSPGDNLLAEFASAVDAVKSAVAIQQDLKTRNAELEEHRKMEFRIGLNVGDVITDEGRLYGDGVNIAARLEGLADPGGICLSGTVHEYVENKLDLAFSYQGEQTVKNIAKPVRVYKVEWEVEASAPTISAASPAELPVPEKPSIAVLPFTNMSNDPEQEYFSDGITEDIITDLSKISGLFVIARNSTFTYKGQVRNVTDVGRELGVRHILEGSVRKAGRRVRINAQLIEAATGGHVWAERYDRELADIFDLQDELTQKIVFALKVTLSPQEQGRFRQAPTANLDAYDAFLQGMEAFWHLTREGNLQARHHYERAVTLDPSYAAAYALLGYTYIIEWILQWNRDPHCLQQAFEFTQHALAMDEAQPTGHLTLGHFYLWAKNEHEQAIAEAEQALTLNPNFAQAYADLGNLLIYAGQPEAAIERIEQAMRLDPHYPPLCSSWLGHAYRLTGQPEAALAILQRGLQRHPTYLYFHLHLVVTYRDLARDAAARAAAAEVMRLHPHFSVAGLGQILPFKDPTVLEHYLDALRQAGLE
jgi:adenylate cyclase